MVLADALFDNYFLACELRGWASTGRRVQAEQWGAHGGESADGDVILWRRPNKPRRMTGRIIAIRRPADAEVGRSAQRLDHQRRAVPRLLARYVAFLRPSCPCDPARSTVPSLDCGAPPSTAGIPLPLRSDLAPSSPVGILGGENHLATIRGLHPEHVCVLRTQSSFTSPNTLYSTLLPIEVL